MAEVGVLRKYVDALEARVSSARDVERVNRGLAWLAWARDYIDAKDPLLRPIEVPVMADYRAVSRRLDPTRTAWDEVEASAL